jgi:hypothetical protein
MDLKNISCQDQIFEIDFHPNRSILIAGLITGCVELWDYDPDNCKRLGKHKVFQQSCRGVAFHENGEELYTISSDCSWKILDSNGVVKVSTQNAHRHPINKLKLLNENLFATGDDNGVVKLWDKRSPAKETMSWDAHTDYITDFAYSAEHHSLLSSGGDATLCVYDIRKQQNFYKSDDQESEIHCISIMKDGKKVYCGTQEGPMLIFKWGDWGDCSDRYLGHTDGIESMVKLDEVTLLTGSLDSSIRVVGLHPHKIEGVLGDLEGLPVEGMKVNHDQTLMASIANDEKIRFWDISQLVNDDDDNENNEDEEGEGNDSDSSADGDLTAADTLEIVEEIDSEGEGEGDDGGEDDLDGSGEERNFGVDENEDEDDDDESASVADDDEEEEEEGEGNGNDEEGEGDAAEKESNDSDDGGNKASNKKNKKKTEKPKPKGTGKKDSDDSEDGDDSDNDSEGSDRRPKKRIKTAREKFYADL